MSDICRYFLPYCLQLQPSGRYVVLNRQYKPLGYTSGHFEYEEYAQDLPGLVEDELSWTVDRTMGVVHLYSDAIYPTRNLWPERPRLYAWELYAPKLETLSWLGARLPTGAARVGPGQWQIGSSEGPLGPPVYANLSRTVIDPLNRSFAAVKVKRPR
jgi:hypothetical protein